VASDEIRFEYQSFVFGELLIPLGMLLRDLATLRGGSNDVQVSPHESGVSGAAFLLIGALVEGSLERHHLDEGQPRGRSIWPFAKQLFSAAKNADSELLRSIEEVVAVRNAVAHCYVWEGTIDQATMTWIDGPWLREDEFGDARHFRVTDHGAVTLRLGLNVMPNKSGRREVAIALQVLDDFWQFMERQGNSQFRGLRGHMVAYPAHPQYMRFSQPAARLERDWAGADAPPP